MEWRQREWSRGRWGQRWPEVIGGGEGRLYHEITCGVEAEGAEQRWMGSEAARGDWRRGREVVP